MLKLLLLDVLHSFWVICLGYVGPGYLTFCSFVFAFRTQLPLTFRGTSDFLRSIHLPNVPKWRLGKRHVCTFRCLRELCDTGKQYLEKGEYLVFQSGTELAVLQTHPFRTILETAQSYCQTCCWNYSSSLFWLCHSPVSTMWALLTACPSFRCSVWGWGLLDLNKRSFSENQKHFCIFPVDFPHSQLQKFSFMGLST